MLNANVTAEDSKAQISPIGKCFFKKILLATDFSPASDLGADEFLRGIEEWQITSCATVSIAAITVFD